MKAKAEREVVIVHEISIWVDLKRGTSASDRKYALYKTGKNFIRIPYSDPNAEKYSYKNGYQNLTGRVPLNELMLVQEPAYHDDDTTCVRRHIWCLDKDCKQALKMVLEAVDNRMTEMKKEMDILYGLWINRATVSGNKKNEDKS